MERTFEGSPHEEPQQLRARLRAVMGAKPPQMFV